MTLNALWSRLEACDRRVSRLNTARALATQQRRALSTVTEWKWATGEMLELNPFVGHILRLPQERWLTRGKPQPFKHVEHGLDRNGRIMCMRRRERFPAGTRVDEDYVAYDRDIVTIAQYGDVTGLTQRHLDRWMSATYADGCLTHYVDLHQDFLLIEEFGWQSVRNGGSRLMGLVRPPVRSKRVAPRIDTVDWGT
jgi:PAS domain-containing protein